MNDYRAPAWLVGGHLQTIWPALFSRRYHGPAPAYLRERWPTPDGDFVDVDFQAAPPGAPMLVLFHGLEGSSASHYAQAFAHWAREAGWSYQRLADRFSVSTAAIHYRCLREGALSPRSQPARRADAPRPHRGFGGMGRLFSVEEDARLLALARDGMKIHHIARELHRPITSCRIRLMKLEISEEMVA